MKRSSILIALAGLASLAAGAQAPPVVETRFENPRRFTDFRVDRWRDPRQTQALAEELRKWLAHEGPNFLPAGTKLTVTITDVDMAGEFESWRGPNAYDIRIVREMYPSRVSLAFSLADADGKVLQEGERKLVSGFLFNGSLQGGDGPLRFEKVLLRDWMAREFSARTVAQRSER